MDARMKELADFCKMQRFDEKVRKQYENADYEEAFCKLVNWEIGMLWILNEGFCEDDMQIEADLHFAEGKEYYIFECIKGALKKEYTRKLVYVGEYDCFKNAVMLHFLPKNVEKLQNLYVTLFIPTGQMNQLCERLNALME